MTSAFAEFARNGYEQASTNQIVKEAGIGKGMLFYYFKSKQELFHYLVEYGINYLFREYIDQLDESETDFIEKYKQAAQVKMKAYNNNPHIFNFFASLFVMNNEAMSKELSAQVTEARKLAYEKLFTNIDTSLFREDIDAEKTIKLIKWSMDGYTEEIINRLKGKQLSSTNFHPFWDEFNDYLAILRKVFYKPKEV